MKIEYFKWWSPQLGRDMELKVYGYYGKPVLVFPAMAGRFFDYEGFKMVDAVSGFIEAGKIKLFTVDSVDAESWSNKSAHPYDRGQRHEAYDRYITQEVVPFIHSNCGGDPQKILTTGCSMGGYHSANFFFRHPDQFDSVISLSGVFHLSEFVGDYMDDTIYLNSPLSYLPNLNDPWYLDQYRQSRIIICCGQGAWEERMIQDVLALKTILEAKGIPAWIDLWGNDVNHDWPWWRVMMPYFLDKLDLPGWSGG
jgi:esterase/lipase superfamily enzyme